MTDSCILELREIEKREMAIEAEKIVLQRRRRELLELNGTRKTRKNMLTPEEGKALFAKIRADSLKLQLKREQ